jgi:hypothetical protein
VHPVAFVALLANRDTHRSHCADNQQLNPVSDGRLQSALDACFRHVGDWFDSNGLSLNPENTEAIALGTIASNS